MKKQEWDAEIESTPAMLATCIAEQFPEFGVINSISLIGEGWDCRVFAVNDTQLFRLPKRHKAVALIRRENQLLPQLAPRLSLAIPALRYIGEASDTFPYPFHGYTQLAGEDACSVPLSEPSRAEAIIVFAKFLKQLHSIDKPEALQLGAKPQVFDRMLRAPLAASLRERVTQLNSDKQSQIDEQCFEQELQLACTLPLNASQPCLVHGDLYAKHLLFKAQTLHAVIDWGDSGINNKAVDLMAVWSFFPASCHHQFFEHYGEVEPNTWAYARFLGIHMGITLLLYGQSIKDDTLVKEAQSSLKRINPLLLVIQ